MVGNPKDSEWYGTPQAKRKRKSLLIYLSDEARERLEMLAPEGMRSAFVEGLIMKVRVPKEKK